MNDVLSRHRLIWKKKKILREIYQDWYKKIKRDLNYGKTLEIGSGTGNFKEFIKDTITSDICKLPWIDMCFDAHTMPFANKSLNNIVMVDVFHHLEKPMIFLNEAHRVLKKGGRIIMIEPFPSVFSLFIYRKFHPEPFIMGVDCFSVHKSNNKDPWASNQALPYLFFFKNQKKFSDIFNQKLKILKREKFSYLLYPLSGGFENKQLIPDFSLTFFRAIEKILNPLKNILSFRCYIVLEKI